jgi:hypothetical protein
MKRVRMLAPFLLLAALAFAQDVTYNFDRDTDFSKYKTYKWVSLKGADTIDELTDKQLKAALDAELGRKGLSATDADGADLYIGYQAAVSQEKQYTSYDTGWGYGRRWGGGTTTTRGETSTIQIGTLVIDMYDAGKHELVWRGAASKALDQKANPEKRQKNLTKAIEKLLKKYPPEQRQS